MLLLWEQLIFFLCHLGLFGQCIIFVQGSTNVSRSSTKCFKQGHIEIHLITSEIIDMFFVQTFQTFWLDYDCPLSGSRLIGELSALNKSCPLHLYTVCTMTWYGQYSPDQNISFTRIQVMETSCQSFHSPFLQTCQGLNCPCQTGQPPSSLTFHEVYKQRTSFCVLLRTFLGAQTSIDERLWFHSMATIQSRRGLSPGRGSLYLGTYQTVRIM